MFKVLKVTKVIYNTENNQDEELSDWGFVVLSNFERKKNFPIVYVPCEDKKHFEILYNQIIEISYTADTVKIIFYKGKRGPKHYLFIKMHTVQMSKFIDFKKNLMPPARIPMLKDNERNCVMTYLKDFIKVASGDDEKEEDSPWGNLCLKLCESYLEFVSKHPNINYNEFD